MAAWSGGSYINISTLLKIKKYTRIKESRENYYYNSAAKDKRKFANSKLREKSQNRKFTKNWARENYQIYSMSFRTPLLTLFDREVAYSTSDYIDLSFESPASPGWSCHHLEVFWYSFICLIFESLKYVCINHGPPGVVLILDHHKCLS